MAQFEDLVSRVAIHISNCPERTIIDAIRDTVRDFCKNTRVWLQDCTPIDVSLEDIRYPLDVPEFSTVIYLWGLEGRNGTYTPSTDYYISHENELVFNELKSARTVKPLVSLMPSLQSDEFPDFLNEYFQEFIVSGAVARLQMQPFRDWSEPNMAAVHVQKYEQGILEAKRMLDEGLNRGRTLNRVRPHYI